MTFLCRAGHSPVLRIDFLQPTSVSNMRLNALLAYIKNVSIYLMFHFVFAKTRRTSVHDPDNQRMPAL
jgi:hypothetical protein